MCIRDRVYAEPRIRPNTKAYYTNYIENHIVPGIGSVPLDKLTTIQIQRFYNNLQKSGRVQRKNFPELKDKSLSPRAVSYTHLDVNKRQSRGSDAPHVHSRLRKHLSRCTLDCGFKTSESPALRGFVGERGRFATTSLYLVLKSNGLHHSKNPPVRFSFSLKIVPANIAKKLPL